MGKKPVVFKPQLHVPEGINNYTGESFRCFTKGDTLPFRFEFINDDGGITDITGWSVTIVISDIQAIDGKVEGDQTRIEVDIPIDDIPTGVFLGDISDVETNSLNAGLNYAEIKFTKDTGEDHFIDMCILEVYPSATFTVV